MNETFVRFLSALVAVFLSLSCFYWKQYELYWKVVTTACLFEFWSVVNKKWYEKYDMDGWLKTYISYCIIIFQVLFFIYTEQNRHLAEFFILLFFVAFAAISILAINSDFLVYSIFSIIWIVYPLHICQKISEKDPESMLMFLTLVWFTDAGAYFFGKFCGNIPFFQSISPKKTLEGTVGGILTAYIVRLVISQFYPKYFSDTWLVLCFIASIIGQFGDLLESLFKRNKRSKDSGKIMPGHGGLLDRMDSVFISIIFAQYFLLYDNEISFHYFGPILRTFTENAIAFVISLDLLNPETYIVPIKNFVSDI